MADRDPEDVQRIFTAAIEIPPSRLDEWLAQQCDGDETLLAEVRGLLQHDRQPDDAFDQGVHVGRLVAEQLLGNEQRGLEHS